jgi:hypothetical protein
MLAIIKAGANQLKEAEMNTYKIFTLDGGALHGAMVETLVLEKRG